MKKEKIKEIIRNTFMVIMAWLMVFVLFVLVAEAKNNRYEMPESNINYYTLTKTENAVITHGVLIFTKSFLYPCL